MPVDEQVLPDLGHGVRGHLRELDGVVHGFWYEHPRPDGSMCSGWAPTRAENEVNWTIEQREPLTLSPSLLCLRCGHHGFVRDGVWVPA